MFPCFTSVEFVNQQQKTGVSGQLNEFRNKMGERTPFTAVTGLARSNDKGSISVWLSSELSLFYFACTYAAPKKNVNKKHSKSIDNLTVRSAEQLLQYDSLYYFN